MINVLLESVAITVNRNNFWLINTFQLDSAANNWKESHNKTEIPCIII